MYSLNALAPTEIYTLSLTTLFRSARLQPTDAQRVQRALEIYFITGKTMAELTQKPRYVYFPYSAIKIALVPGDRGALHERIRSEEHTSELQSLAYLVCRLLLEKKK